MILWDHVVMSLLSSSGLGGGPCLSYCTEVARWFGATVSSQSNGEEQRKPLLSLFLGNLALLGGSERTGRLTFC